MFHVLRREGTGYPRADIRETETHPQLQQECSCQLGARADTGPRLFPMRSQP